MSVQGIDHVVITQVILPDIGLFVGSHATRPLAVKHTNHVVLTLAICLGIQGIDCIIIT